MIIPIPKYTGHVNSPRFGTTLWFTVGSLEVFIRFDTDFYCNDCKELVDVVNHLGNQVHLADHSSAYPSKDCKE